MRSHSHLFFAAKRFFSKGTSTSTRTELDENSKITRVRIWKSVYVANDGSYRPCYVPYAILKLNSGLKNANIGHASVETSDFYASFWPNALSSHNKLSVQSGRHVSIDDDYEWEGRNPDCLVDLKTLDTDAMRIELEKFKENKYWLFGPSALAEKNTAASCTGLAHALLQSGGIGKLVSPRLSVRDCLFVTPNNLGHLVLLAKQREEELEKQRRKAPQRKSK